MALGTFTPGQPLMENKLVVIDPAGEVVATYFKGRPVPGDPETGASASVPTVTTPLGNIAFAICYDMDFPGYIRQAGHSQADVLIVPASDPDGIDPIHTRMAVYRAIENGCALVRQTHNGLSAATDYQGRVLASMDYFTTTDRVMVSHVPTRGTRTIYAQIGDLFAWVCLAGLALGVLVSLRVRMSELSPGGTDEIRSTPVSVP
jgi:apolipoprotein N-acyltransferase